MARKLVELKGIKKSYGDNTILKDLNMSINENEFVTLLGPSGCGKTTTLRIIGGFETMQEGQLLLDGVEIGTEPSHKRPINTVFQRYALFPHLNIFDNVAFGLRNNVYSNVYDIGVYNLLVENNFDEEEIDNVIRHLENFSRPKDVKKAAIEFFADLSITVELQTELNDVKKQCKKMSFDNYSIVLNEILKNHELAIELEGNTFKDTAKAIIDKVSSEDVYYKILLKLQNRKFKEEVINKEVKNALKLVNLSGYENREISSLSGGQMQRIAIARAIVNKPKILLLDEPLAALDLKLRQSMRYELKAMQKNLGITFIFVTHDQEEAMVMSDTIVVMNNGEIQQIGRPEDVYNAPTNRFVANFIGSSNIVRGKYLGNDRLEALGKTFKVDVHDFEENEKIWCIVEKEDFDVVPLESAKLIGVVQKVTFNKKQYELEVLINETKIKVINANKFNVGDEIGFTIDPQNIYCESKTENKQTLLANYDGDNIMEGVYLTQNQVSFLGADFDCYITIFEKDEIVDVMVRPEDFDLVIEEPEKAILQGVVTSSVFTGVHFELHIDVNGQQLLVHDYQNCEVGQVVGLKVDFFEIHLMKVNADEEI